MIIGSQLRALREFRNLSQGDIQNRTGLLRCYISRVENGHTVPALETLEKFARALEVPLYSIFHAAGDKGQTLEPRSSRNRLTQRLIETMGQLSQDDREILLTVARQMARKGKR